MKRTSVWLASLALFVVISGCVRETTDGDARVYRYELWVPGLLLLGGLVAIPIGLSLRRQAKRGGWILVIIGPIAALLGAPSLFLDRVDVRPDGFSRHSGFWGMTAVQEVNFADVNSMRLVEREERGRRGRKVMRTYLISDLKSGPPVELPASNEVSRAAMPEIVKNAAAHGISITGLPD
jgi:hypothetical protein